MAKHNSCLRRPVLGPIFFGVCFVWIEDYVQAFSDHDNNNEGQLGISPSSHIQNGSLNISKNLTTLKGQNGAFF